MQITDTCSSQDTPPTRRDLAIFLTLLRDARPSHNNTPSSDSPKKPKIPPTSSPRETRNSQKTFDIRHNDPDHLRLKVNTNPIILVILYLSHFKTSESSGYL
jgi:hypothetical protein